MKPKLIAAVSAIAITLSSPAHPAEADAPTSVTDTINRPLSASDIKAFFIDNDATGIMTPVVVRGNLTAQHLIGNAVVDPQGRKLATVRDIIIGRDGRAALVVVADDGLLGIGSKIAAFDYNKVVSHRYDGTVAMALTQDMIDRAADFSYDMKDWPTAKVVPAGSISTNQLLDGDVLDSDGNKAASIENVYFRPVDVIQVIVKFNTTMGTGGDLATLDFDDMQLVRGENSVDFKLTQNQSDHFRRFKATASKQ